MALSFLGCLGDSAGSSDAVASCAVGALLVAGVVASITFLGVFVTMFLNCMLHDELRPVDSGSQVTVSTALTDIDCPEAKRLRDEAWRAWNSAKEARDRAVNALDRIRHIHTGAVASVGLASTAIATRFWGLPAAATTLVLSLGALLVTTRRYERARAQLAAAEATLTDAAAALAAAEATVKAICPPEPNPPNGTYLDTIAMPTARGGR